MPSFAEPPFQKYQRFDDGTIISGEYVIRSIQEFESKVNVTSICKTSRTEADAVILPVCRCKTEHGDAFVYAFRSNDENAKTYKIVIGPLETDVAVDLNKLPIVVGVYAHIPFVGKVIRHRIFVSYHSDSFSGVYFLRTPKFFQKWAEMGSPNSADCVVVKAMRRALASEEKERLQGDWLG
ncbi:hypothetical protein EDD15DRAFT_2368264 [Pisolithus albus]|nr:hypothetical protein EDD15DRAFT_2368264 [Pisolithus albus]